MFHYNGHGVPKPTSNGEVWMFNPVRVRKACEDAPTQPASAPSRCAIRVHVSSVLMLFVCLFVCHLLWSVGAALTSSVLFFLYLFFVYFVALFVALQHYTQYVPASVYDIQMWCGSPAVFVFDCSSAAVLIPHFTRNGDLSVRTPLLPSAHLSQPLATGVWCLLSCVLTFCLGHGGDGCAFACLLAPCTCCCSRVPRSTARLPRRSSGLCWLRAAKVMYSR